MCLQKDFRRLDKILKTRKYIFKHPQKFKTSDGISFDNMWPHELDYIKQCKERYKTHHKLECPPVKNHSLKRPLDAITLVKSPKPLTDK